VSIVTVGQVHQFLTNFNSIEWMGAAPAWADGPGTDLSKSPDATVSPRQLAIGRFLDCRRILGKK
jgi:hypothetical protein